MHWFNLVHLVDDIEETPIVNLDYFMRYADMIRGDRPRQEVLHILPEGPVVNNRKLRKKKIPRVDSDYSCLLNTFNIVE